MFGQLRTWRRWHRKVLKGQKRYAVASALAASAVPALVAARGHKISNLPEIPLVVANEALEGLGKTKKALAVLKKLKVDDDVSRVKYNVVHRAGKGKLRNRPYKEKLGPLIVHSTGHSANVSPAIRNLPGVEISDVNSLSLLRLAPGGHLGRLVIWTRGAFEQLDKIWGNGKTPSQLKHGFSLPRPIMANPDVTRIITADEIRSSLRPIRVIEKRKRWVNPLRHFKRYCQLNPYARSERANNRSMQQRAIKATEERIKKAKARPVPTEKPTKKVGQPNTSADSKRRARTAKFKKILLAP